MNSLKAKDVSLALFGHLISNAKLLAETFRSIRLCLVGVKYFPENIYFPEMLFSGKENIFKCLVVF